MQLNQQPPKIPTPFAAQAPYGNVTNPIPNTAQTGGFVSWPTGFQQINFTQQAAGGIPPWGQDFNGLFQIFSAWIQWFQAGGAPPKFDQVFANEIGGYPQGAFLANATVIGSFWINQQDNNMANPDTGGANWLGFPPAFQVPPAPPPVEIFPAIPPPPQPTILPPQETIINNVTLENFLDVNNYTQPGPSNGRLMNVRIFNVPGNYYYLPSNAPCSAVEVIMQGGGGAGGGAGGQGPMLPGAFSAGGGGGAGGIVHWYGPCAYLAGQLISVGAGGVPEPHGGTGGDGYGSTAYSIQCWCGGGQGGQAGGGQPGDPQGQGQLEWRYGGPGGPSSGGNVLTIPGAWGNYSSGRDPQTFLSGGGANNYFNGGGGPQSGPFSPYSPYWNSGPLSYGNSGQMGGGGSGAANDGTGPTQLGGPGGAGFIIIKEYS